MTSPGTPEKLVWENCPCGHQVCKRSNPANLGHFNVGAGFEPDEAAELDRRWSLYPELVEALEWAVNHFEGRTRENAEQLNNCIDRCRTVAAKARGEQP